MKRPYLFLVLFALIAAITIGWSLILNSKVKADENKASDLLRLSGDIQNYASANNTLPKNLAAVRQTAPLAGKIADYNYTRESYYRYQLCATFTFATNKTPQSTAYNPLVSDGYLDATIHGSGHQCFSVAISSITQPTPFIEAPTSVPLCTVGSRDQQYTFSDVTLNSYSNAAQTVSLSTNSQQQTFRWCTTPVVTTNTGANIGLSQIPKGALVTAYVTSPATIDKYGRADYASPYVTKIVLQRAQKNQ